MEIFTKMKIICLLNLELNYRDQENKALKMNKEENIKVKAMINEIISEIFKMKTSDINNENFTFANRFSFMNHVGKLKKGFVNIPNKTRVLILPEHCHISVPLVPPYIIEFILISKEVFKNDHSTKAIVYVSIQVRENNKWFYDPISYVVEAVKNSSENDFILKNIFIDSDNFLCSSFLSEDKDNLKIGIKRTDSEQKYVKVIRLGELNRELAMIINSPELCYLYNETLLSIDDKRKFDKRVSYQSIIKKRPVSVGLKTNSKTTKTDEPLQLHNKSTMTENYDSEKNRSPSLESKELFKCKHCKDSFPSKFLRKVHFCEKN